MIGMKAFINGKIFTLNPHNPWAQAVVTFQNKIIYVGSTNYAKKLAEENSIIIDIEGKLMLPGFIDSHVHMLLGGMNLLSVDFTKCKSKDDFILTLHEFVKSNKGKWITGGAWDEQSWSEKIVPKKEWIDSFTEDTPVFVLRKDLHMGLANSLALKLANIDSETESPDGGVIEKDHNTGEPAGILKEKAADLILRVIPELTEEKYRNAEQAALDEAKKFGVTSIHDITYKNHFRVHQIFEKENKLTCRISTRPLLDYYQQYIDTEISTTFGSDKLKFAGLKAFTDGALGSSTAWFYEAYLDDPANYGLPMDIVNSGELKRWSVEADKSNVQLSVHGIGDRAVGYLLDFAEELNSTNGNKDRRFRIEHAQHIRESDIKRCNDLDVIISAQPYHMYEEPWIVNKIGKERERYTYAFKSFLDNNVKLCFGSDWPVVTLDPIQGIYSAVTRLTSAGNELVPEEKISVENAIKCYTINAAYANYDENKLGSIEVGKLADMVVLCEDLFLIDPKDIKNVKVDMTVFDGEVIYKR